MGWAALVGAGISMIGNAQSAAAMAAMNEFQAGLLENQAELNNQMSVIEQGDISQQAAFDLNLLREKGEQTEASQTAAMAENGITSDSATFQDIIDDTFKTINKDMSQVLENRDDALNRLKLNTKLANLNLSANAKLYRMAGSNAVNAALLQNIGTGISAYGQYAQNNYQRQNLTM